MINEVKDFVRYLDTTYPRNVNRALYTELKYLNKDKLREFCDKYEEVDSMLVEKVALAEFLRLSDKEKLDKLKMFMEVE